MRFLILAVLVGLCLVVLLALQYQTLRTVQAVRGVPAPTPAVVNLCPSSTPSATPEVTAVPQKSQGLFKQQPVSSPSGAR